MLVSVVDQPKKVILTNTEIDNTEALAKYYRLLLSIARVITSVILSRGPQNEQTIDSAKTFLTENRPLIVSMFKRQAKIGGVSFDDAGVDIEELVELFVLLIAMTGFLDVGLCRWMLIDGTEANISSSMKSNGIPSSHGGQLSRNRDLIINTSGAGSGIDYGKDCSAKVQDLGGWKTIALAQ